jgi:hypothetical protein
MQLSDKEQLEIIKLRLLTNDISFKQAKELSKEYIDNINNKSKEIAKKYNQRPKLINFAGIIR